jgi:hypothetical protein
MRPHSRNGDGTPVSELVGRWKQEGWYLFGLIPLYIRDFEPRGHYTCNGPYCRDRTGVSWSIVRRSVIEPNWGMLECLIAGPYLPHSSRA